ncbi:MAG TPA: VTT domain-containing protein, partial [Acidimicrobiales bacterium]
MLAHVLAAGGFLDPEKLLTSGGLMLLLAIIFAESGLLIGFFLPGDSLLFLAGFMASDPEGFENVLPAIWIVVPLLFLAAAAGDQVGYIFGRRVGPSLFNRPDSRLFHKGNVVKAQVFFDKHGSKTIVLARFVPVVRTFAPILAGVARM